jgi:hypothetical protein
LDFPEFFYITSTTYLPIPVEPQIYKAHSGSAIN